MRIATPTLAFLTLVGLLTIPACSGGSESTGPEAEATTSAPAESAPAESAPESITAGPYTWAPGVNTSSPEYVKCWARLTATPSPDFPNPYDSLQGPVEVAYLRDLDAGDTKVLHPDWTGRVIGVAAGPTARVTVYAQDGVRGASYTLGPGAQADLQQMGLERVASLRIEYVE